MKGAGPLTLALGCAMAWGLLAREAPPSGASATGALCAKAGGTVTIAAGATMLGEDGPGVPGAVTRVRAFRIDRTEVTNRQFAAFVEATGYVTEAEKQGEAAVFIPPVRLERGLEDPGQWWRMVAGATWRHPQGPGSSIDGALDLPVVQVTFRDALAYARWRGGTLPSEAQWERAARGDQQGHRDRHSWARSKDGAPLANAWDGVFPVANTGADGFRGVAPVGCFPPNDFGLFDMVGNVWEWTLGAGGEPAALRGGSYLCSRNYCANYTPTGRQEHEADLATSHAGFRVVYPVGAGDGGAMMDRDSGGN